MRKQRLLENENQVDFYTAISIILFIIGISIFLSLIELKFLKFENIENEIIFAGILTAIVETGLIFFLFLKYPVHFLSLFKKPFLDFFKGVLWYFLSLPVLFFLASFSFYIFKKANLSPIPQEIFLVYFKIDSPLLLSFLFFLTSIIAPFVEEIIFRGFIYPGFKEKFSVKSSIFLTSLIFGLFHHEIFTFLGIFFLGFLLTYIFEKTRNLWISIGLHFSNNFFANIAIFIIKFVKDQWSI